MIHLFNTVKYLKSKQIRYRLYYFARKRFRRGLGKNYTFSKSANTQTLKFQKSIHISDAYFQNQQFNFLNLNKKFENSIDWNYSKYGKLWTYNLTYFDYLSQEDKVKKLFLIESFIDNIKNIKDGLEPFPISLRGINWIKYLSFQKIKNQKIDNSLYAQYYILLDNLEYHLLGNHLLENGFSLLFGAYYFQDEVLYKKSKEILEQELEEQILKDGAHFELSPMYHQIMLFRLLDCINLLQNNSWKEDNLLEFFILKAQSMLGWLDEISYNNGDIPLLNDSSHKIAPTTTQLFEYAQRLNVNKKNQKLKESGYRKISKSDYECIVDVGEIGASYIPGHAHADTFNFELYIKDKPFIVDMGLSTYETNHRRTIERSTSSHNTVEVNGQNQSQVWGGFRVGNRAKIVSLKENDNLIEATHDGYKQIGVLHTRKWIFEDAQIIIEDNLSIKTKSIAKFHFHPSISKKEILERIIFKNKNFIINTYQYSPEFNIHVEAYVLEITFEKKLKIKILTFYH